MRPAEPGDDEVLGVFLRGAAGPFPHRAHLRVARLYLTQLPLGEAIDRFAADLKAFAASKGAAGKYHHTITVAFLLLLRSRLAAAPEGETFDAFLARNPDLADARCLHAFYSEAALGSELARRDFVFPDRTATPDRMKPFPLERYFATWEFTATHLLGSSDVEGMRMDELLALADEEGAALWRGLKLGYTESRGHPLLRAEIAKLYQGVSPDEVLTFTGAEEAIYAVLTVSLAQGDHAVVTWPAYTSLVEVAKAAGAKVTPWRLEPDGGAWRADVGALERAVKQERTALVVWNFPHNPTGALPSRADFDAAIGLARAAGARVFSDEVYRLLEPDADRLPAAVEVDARAVSLGVMSKSFGLAGLRVGWIATHDRALLERAAAFKDYLTICASAPSEVLALIALRARDRVLARNRGIVAEARRAADAFFAEWRSRFRWLPPRGGTVAFPELLDGSAEAMADALVRAEGVLVVPGALFDHPGQHFRIGLGRTNAPEAFQRFDRFLRRGR